MRPTGLDSEQATAAAPPTPSRTTSSGLPDRGRFLPGSVLLDRYRVVALLGRGGMGEVYRAEDLKLGVTVALKFLPQQLGPSESMLDRFMGEVRLARQISHPNVCRVFDVGEVEGQHFFSMEYIDGEDLGSLLRRIGRLPSEKAAQIARQLCLGLTAAHELGILHRDLKPGNVMIDGRGSARIADFGLAALVDEVAGSDVRDGTPAYMAPEQLSGETVSVKSDLYALGLVLYELFTGSPAFQASSAAELERQRSSGPSPPSSHVEAMDPAAERVILQCLESEPESRPDSALAVAAALPGADPLAAAMAAGETPSPEVVAQAGGTGSLSRPVAWGLLAATLAGVLLFVNLQARTHLMNAIDSSRSPEALAERARSILADLGHSEPAVDTLFGFRLEQGYFDWLLASGLSGPLDEQAPQEASVVSFWYRQGSAPLERLESYGVDGPFSDHPAALPGMVRIVLTPDGKLRELTVATPEADTGEPAATEIDPATLFQAIGFAGAALDEVPPTWLPPVFVDERRAWRHRDSTLEAPLRIEAGFLHRRPVAARVVYAWSGPDRKSRSQEMRSAMPAGFAIVLIPFFVVLVVGAALLAHRNLRAGRGDQSGATKIAAFVLISGSVIWVVESHHVPTLAEANYLLGGLGASLVSATIAWLFYLALEPYFRRLWPDLLISWSRLLDGRFRDPLVGRHLLVGCLAAVLMATGMTTAFLWGSGETAYFHPLSDNIGFGERLRLGVLNVPMALAFCALLALLQAIGGRRSWSQIGFVVIASSFLAAANSQLFGPAFGIPSGLLMGVLISAVLLRAGLLSLLLLFVLSDFLMQLAVSLDPAVWYFRESVLTLGVFLAITLWGFYHSLGGRPIPGIPAAEAIP